MKKLILAAAFVAFAGSVLAQEVVVAQHELGSNINIDETKVWDNDAHVYHVPQYMPGYPTAAVIYPRVIEVPCKQTNNVITCKGYNWSPELGRGEYLMIRPIREQQPKVVTNTIVKEVPGPAITVIKEVPVKKTKE